MPASDVLLPFVEALKQLNVQIVQRRKPTRQALNELAKASCYPDDPIEEQSAYLTKAVKHLCLDHLEKPADDAQPAAKDGFTLLRLAISEPDKLIAALAAFSSIPERAHAVAALIRWLEQYHERLGKFPKAQFEMAMNVHNIDEKTLREHFENDFEFGDAKWMVAEYLDTFKKLLEINFPTPMENPRILKVDSSKPNNGKPGWLMFATRWSTSTYPEEFSAESIHDWLRWETYVMDMGKKLISLDDSESAQRICADCEVLRNHAIHLRNKPIQILLEDYLQQGIVRALSDTARVAQTPIHETDKDSRSAIAALLKVYTDGVSDERINEASAIVVNANLSSATKLERIDKLIRLPASASAQDLGDLLGVSKQAILKTLWWQINRQGEKADEVGKRTVRRIEIAMANKAESRNMDMER